MIYHNILYVQILIWDSKNFARVTSKPKKHFKGYISAKLVIRTFFFARSEFLRIVGAANVSIILIIIYYLFKYSVGIKTTLL